MAKKNLRRNVIKNDTNRVILNPKETGIQKES